MPNKPLQNGFQAKLGRLEIVERLFTSAAQVTNGFVFDRWDIDRREIPRAHQSRQLTASRRSVFTRSPAFLGTSEGATSQQAWPFVVRERESQDPHGPASSTKTRCLAYVAEHGSGATRNGERIAVTDAAVAFLASAPCDVSGIVIRASNGQFSMARWSHTEEVTFGPGVITPEAVAAWWNTLTGLR